MSKNITIAGTNYNNVPSIEIPLQTTGTASFYEVSDATATTSDILDGKTAYVDGGLVTGSVVFQTYYTGSSTPSSSLGVDGDIYLQS